MIFANQKINCTKSIIEINYYVLQQEALRSMKNSGIQNFFT